MKNFIALSLITLFFLASCNNSDKTIAKEEMKSSGDAIEATQAADVVPANTHKIVVLEEMSSGGYIYLKVQENEKEYWMAVPGREVVIGATYYFDGGMEMRGFESKTLNRTFESIIFAEGIREDIKGAKKVAKKSVQKGETSVTNVEKAPGGIRIAELFETPGVFSNKEVIIKAQVMKVSNGIMGVNFVHIQDGTTGNGNYDLTITSNDEFQVDDVVTIKGTVVLNKDFGSGYSYDVIIEKAVIL